MMTPRSVEQLIYHMPTVEQQASDEWVQGFAASIRQQSRRRNWRPCPKQLSTMHRLVNEVFGHQDDEDITLIEEDDI